MNQVIIDRKIEDNKRTILAPRVVRTWLLLGVVLVFGQVFIGGVTRLTDSGLSITEWAVIQGTLPPLNQEEWLIAFDKYKEAANKQYSSLHADMSLQEFKVIFFWEYFHRLWARMMGFVFAIPLVYFLYKKMISASLLKRLGIVFLLAATAATFGWIMVASGLNNDQRTWVSAYKLVIHLGIATSLFGYLFVTYLKASQEPAYNPEYAPVRRFSNWVLGILIIQILFGGLMAGMKAGLVHPHYPFFIQADGFFRALNDSSGITVDAIINYEPSAAVKAWVQVFHRFTAYLLVAVIIKFFFDIGKVSMTNPLRLSRLLLVIVLVIQICLGILTVINSIGRIPIAFGVIHQGLALIMLAIILFIRHHLNTRKVINFKNLQV